MKALRIRGDLANNRWGLREKQNVKVFSPHFNLGSSSCVPTRYDKSKINKCVNKTSEMKKIKHPRQNYKLMRKN
jgi:hypothetical protein